MRANDTPERPGLAACAACAVTPSAQVLARHAQRASEARIMLSLPGLSGTSGMSQVERTLSAHPQVRAARVNLTRKRVTVTAEPNTLPETLISVLDGIGIEAHELDSDTVALTGTDRAGRELLMRLGVAGFASMNVMLLSVSVWSGADDATRDLFHWISAAITFPAILFAGQPFFRNTLAALRARQLNMDVPITLAILLALATSLWETALSGHHAYFDAALMLTFFLLAGRYLDHRTRAVARSAAEELAALEVPRAIRRRADGSEETVPLSALVPGDAVVVRPGGRMPVDGLVTEGASELDRSLLTGETLPVQALPGMAVSAGEVNLTGPLVLRATAIGPDSSLHALTDLVAVAESGRGNYNSLADRAAKLYAPGVHILSALSFAGWYLATGDLRQAVNIAAAVLIITCPCALGLAVPAVTTAASGRLFRRGLLIKSGTALERLAAVDTVIFDKTGTLTGGAPTLSDADVIPQEQLALSAALGQGSAHPLARALAQAAQDRALDLPAVTGLREVPGYGIEAQLSGQCVRLGRGDWLGAPATPGGAADDAALSTWLRVGDAPPIRLRFADRLRPGAAEAVAGLKRQGLAVRLVSGDAPAAVAALAAQVGIDDWQARATPAEKAALVAALPGRVLMVGDGLNDTAALAAAHVSVSPASALDAARVASDIVLLGRDLSALAEARAVAVQATRRISENFRIATVYNVVAVPLAVAGLATPLIAALAMSLSSITVSLNALRVAGRRSPAGGTGSAPADSTCAPDTRATGQAAVAG
ncbi:cadmium-translocating P-type ATPase [Meridianimarinicoccus roseus]|uniref:Cadmium-translocating P-type ATPase n=1 Tax=Meridianimarinicoccus roseus TaxID=2072018 RepID=A0A2V2LEE3_9RHOB|nr:heavy metal translocating P-type ATPase [Meridianimarinicoccus roseus]PWR01616.1 cadmium-translocating P-type ATPase [Meridianimarinicoccus roseus]